MTSSPPLHEIVLDSRARDPLHVQLAEAIRDRIREGQLQPGESLPSDAQVQKMFGISRSVARQAMNTLVAEGVVLRSRGRGSVVAPLRQHHRLAHRAAGLSSQVSQSGSEVRTSVLRLERQRPLQHNVQLGEEVPVYLERLREIDGLPAAYIRTWLPPRFGADLTEAELIDTSLHKLLENRHGIKLTGGSRQVRAVSADNELARLLKTRQGAPLLLLEGTTTASDDSVIELFSTWHRGDLITFDLDVSDQPEAAKVGADPAHSHSEVLVAETAISQQLLRRIRESAHQLLKDLDSLG